MRPAERRKHEKACEAWNAANKPGARVIVRLDSGEQRETTTRTDAYCASSGHAIVFLQGISGYYLLDRVRAAT